MDLRATASQADLSSVMSPGVTQYSIWTLVSGILPGWPLSGIYMYGHANEGGVHLPYLYQLIKGGGRTILFDVGWEDPQYLKLYGIVDWEPITVQLARLGVKPEDVDTVVLSHMHLDHVGQIRHFANATFYLQKTELDYVDWAMSYPVEGPRTFYSWAFDKNDLAALKHLAQEGRLVLTDGYHDVGSGLKIVPALHTHSPGCQMLVVNTAVGQMVVTGDVAYTRLNITSWTPLGFHQGSTIEGMKAYEKVMNLVGGNIDLVVPSHDPDTFSYWPSWQSGATMVAEVALAPGQASLRPA
jgi:N-acyl homoserine lactone hydrolase